MPHVIWITGLNGAMVDQLIGSRSEGDQNKELLVTDALNTANQALGLIDGRSIPEDDVADAKVLRSERESIAAIFKNWTGPAVLWYADPALCWTVAGLSNVAPCTFLLCYESPIAFVSSHARSPIGGLEPLDIDGLMALWHRYNGQLLSVFRAHPDNSLLIRTDRLVDKGGDLVSELERMVSGRIPSDIEALLRGLAQPDAADLIESEFGEAIMAQGYSEVHDLFLELESCATLMGRQPEFDVVLPDIADQAREFIRMGLRLGAALHECSVREQEVTVARRTHASEVLEQNQANAKLQMELAAMKAEGERLRTSSLAEGDVITTLQDQLLERERRITEIEGVGDLLKLQLQQMQEELEYYHSENKISRDTHAREVLEHKQATATLQSELAAMKAEGERLRTSRLAEGEAIGTLQEQLLEREKRIKEIEGDSELLQLQLQQMQAELEYYYSENGRARQMLDEFCEIQRQTRGVVSRLLHLPALASIIMTNNVE